MPKVVHASLSKQRGHRVCDTVTLALLLEVRMIALASSCSPENSKLPRLFTILRVFSRWWLLHRPCRRPALTSYRLGVLRSILCHEVGGTQRPDRLPHVPANLTGEQLFSRLKELFKIERQEVRLAE